MKDIGPVFFLLACCWPKEGSQCTVALPSSQRSHKGFVTCFKEHCFLSEKQRVIIPPAWVANHRAGFDSSCLRARGASHVVNLVFTKTAEIHARSLVNFYRQYADRHMNLKFM